MTKLYIVVNEDRFFLSHRKDIALRAQLAGYDVTVVCKDTGRKQEILDIGLKWISLPINPTGVNLGEELRTFHFLLKLYKRRRPDIVHHVGLKNVLWGGLAARMAGVPAVVNAICGLGVLFSGNRLSLRARLVMTVLRLSGRRPDIIYIFQNHEDMHLFVDYKIVRPEHSVLIKGSGVDLNKCGYSEEPAEGKVRVIFTARMVREKGTLVLCEAAELLRGEMQEHVEFLLCGALSQNPDAISRQELEAHCDGSYIRWLGYRDDARRLVRDSHILAFPSYYREGVPLSLIEAAAIGRPIVTTDSIGCRDTVDDGVNGFLVPPRDAHALADRLRRLINDRELRIRMGRKGREKAEREFSLDTVIETHLDVYNRLRKAVDRP